MTTPRPLIAGNWKMNGLAASLDEARAVAAALDAHPVGARVALCPPATLVERMAQVLAGTGVAIGGQDCRAEAGGAFTGDISAEMLAEAGASLVILGHSERRAGHGETDSDVAAKVAGALRAGLEPIVCVGETLEQRQAGQALAVVTGQLRGSLPAALADADFAVAYEPVWAIGSGLTPSLAEIEEVHVAARATLVELFGAAGARVPILYGGSVKPSNARDILAVKDVGGALVGGASLKAADFLGIINAA
ncbi:triosephosphate isomerase [Caulobacter ginsengisoli]|uniref:Triosephosphate isomerase n=1 Tax=Caulobacter ginsengisoli TaxID=400775 RepID=A0ABU0ILZ9_9CAUL|nr:triose-phosphate isomerase [Caulobacter ginsengisoli]MDQ0463047.1 triosephosphate isomerase [Caulobacter ginsengisoli]